MSEDQNTNSGMSAMDDTANSDTSLGDETPADETSDEGESSMEL